MAENFDRHNAALESDAHNALAVVGGLGDGASHVGSVTLIVASFAAAVDEVPARHEVSFVEVFALGVFIPSFVGYTGIDDGYNHVFAGRDRPSLLGFDLIHVPLQWTHWVVGEAFLGGGAFGYFASTWLCHEQIVGAYAFDRGFLFEAGDGSRHLLFRDGSAGEGRSKAEARVILEV